MKIAVIATSFNRREKTLRAFHSLNANGKYNLDFYLCDDASTDGTPEAIKDSFRNATVLEGTGDLFWSKGMYVAMKAAVKKDYDLYLMINDDVEFFEDALGIMLMSYKKANRACGIVGPTCGEDNTMTTYGGKLINGDQFLKPNGELQECDLANWNCFLIDREIIKNIGLIDNKYEHAHGDYDYSLMMKRNGYPVYVATKHIGACNRNSHKNTFADKNVPRRKRLGLLFSKRGVPFKSGVHYHTKNFQSLGIQGYKSLFLSYIKCIFCIVCKKDF